MGTFVVDSENMKEEVRRDGRVIWGLGILYVFGEAPLCWEPEKKTRQRER